MRQLGERRRLMSEINVVPYIDVMLVLLIIFMITAPLISQGVKIDLPQAPSELLPPSDNEPVIVTVDAGGSVFVDFGEDPDKPVGDSGTGDACRRAEEIPTADRGHGRGRSGRGIMEAWSASWRFCNRPAFPRSV